MSPAALTITASSPAMTYGGSVPTITPGYSGFVNGDTGLLAEHDADLLHDGHRIEPSLASHLSDLLLGGGDPELHNRLRRRCRHGGQGVAHHRRFQPDDDLRRLRPVHHGWVLGFVNGDTASSLTTAPTCCDHGRQFESGCRVAVRILVQRCGRPQLRHQLRGRFGHGGQGHPDDHRVE